MMEINQDWNEQEKKEQLFRDQKKLLDTFLEHGAISQAQYDKSLVDLIIKMGIRSDMDQQDDRSY